MRGMTLRLMLTLMATSQIPTGLTAQAIKIGVVDVERAIVQTVEGKKAEAAFTAKFETLRKDIETKQKQLEDQQNKLKTQDRVLSDAVKADLAKDIQRRQTDLTRIQEDAQKELETMRGELMRPIAEVTETVLNAFAKELGYTVIIDTSNPQNSSVVFANPTADVTEEVIRRVDAAMAAKTPAPKKP